MQEDAAMNVMCIVTYPNGSSRMKVIDWDNREQVKEFARCSRSWLEHGAIITTRETLEPVMNKWHFRD